MWVFAHGNQHVEHVSVAQAWSCACSGWTVWVLTGSRVGLASDFSPNDCVTSIYIQMWLCTFRVHISIEVITNVLCTALPSLFCTLWIVSSLAVLPEERKCSCQYVELFYPWRLRLSSKAVRAAAEERHIFMYLSQSRRVRVDSERCLRVWACVFFVTCMFWFTERISISPSRGIPTPEVLHTVWPAAIV